VKKLTCPNCKKENTVPIVYGFMDVFGEDEEDEEDEGDYVLGGCVVNDNDPDYFCRGCGHKWMHTDTE